MKIYDLENSNKNGALIVAKNEKRAKEIFLILKYVKNIKNCKCRDITDEYIQNHQERGFKLNELSEGQLVQDIGKKSKWSTFLNI